MCLINNLGHNNYAQQKKYTTNDKNKLQNMRCSLSFLHYLLLSFLFSIFLYIWPCSGDGGGRLREMDFTSFLCFLCDILSVWLAEVIYDYLPYFMCDHLSSFVGAWLVEIEFDCLPYFFGDHLNGCASAWLAEMVFGMLCIESCLVGCLISVHDLLVNSFVAFWQFFFVSKWSFWKPNL